MAQAPQSYRQFRLRIPNKFPVISVWRNCPKCGATGLLAQYLYQ
jgi:hypothetical protein